MDASLMAEDDTFAETLDTLTRRIDNMKFIIRSFKELAPQRKTKAAAEMNMQTHESYWQDCKVLDRRLYRLATTEDANNAYFKKQQFNALMSEYLEDKTFFHDFITQLSAAPVPQEGHESAGNDLFKLKRIEPDKFTGDMSKWNNFKNLYDQLVHNNVRLPIIQKFFLLRNSLEGEPFNLIENIQVTEPNYATAYKLLTDRYEDEVSLIWTNLKDLFSIKRMKGESSEEARRLHDQTVRACEVLKNLRRKVEHWDDILVYITVNKMDTETRKHYELHTNTINVFPTFDLLKTFLDNHARRIARVPAVASSSKQSNRFSARSHHTTTDDKVVCPCCHSDHNLYSCNLFKNKSVSERREFVASKGLCFNCFQGNHGAKECSSSGRCRNCKKRHHTLLCEAASSAKGNNANKSNAAHAAVDNCDEEDPHSGSGAEESSSDEESTEVTACQSSQAAAPLKSVILATAMVRLRTIDGRTMTARALLDQGSELSFISEPAARSLRAPRVNVNVTISGINGNKTASCSTAITCVMEPCDAEKPSLPVTAHVLPKLTSYVPRRHPSEVVWKHLQGLKLADPDPTDKRVDMIIGADLYPAIILDGIKRGSIDSPMAQNTIFGWVISGPQVTPESCPQESHVSVNHCIIQPVDEPVDVLIRRFWELEDIPTATGSSEEDEWCRNHFKESHTRGPDGRFTVEIPLKGELPLDIGESYGIARKCHERQQRRLESNPRLKSEYDKFLQEYLDAGHMRLVTERDDLSWKPVYLSHLAVLREDSTTSPVRVVFNASGMTTNGTSLNDHLHTGPQLLPDLVALITRWRRHPIVLKADIKQMFRQIWVNKKHCHLQRILWKSLSAKTLEAYELLTVTYGTKPAPSLSSLVLEQLSEDEKSKLPRAAKILMEDFYVDDVLTGARTIQQAREIQSELQELLASGGFILRKWASSHPEVLKDLSPELLAHNPALRIQGEVAKVLGILWDMNEDAFRIAANLEKSDGSTKREILSTIARIFDPVGWLTPASIVAKILIQEMWLQGLNWDDEAPEDIATKWDKFHTDLIKLRDIKIPRYVGFADDERDMQIHGFCDASKQAYAAVVYLRARVDANHVTTHLLMGKSKVAPIKHQTIAKLELCAAHLLSRLLEKMTTVMNLHRAEIHAWTDSEIVLAWLRKHASNWPTFVANRVSDIQTRVPKARWHHVPTASNPADCASRGIPPGDLPSHNLWWTGPKWLRLEPGQWPHSSNQNSADIFQTTPSESTTEATACAAAGENAEPQPIERDVTNLPWLFDAWPKLLRITAYCLKFLNLKKKQREHPLTFSELIKKAKLHWIQREQEATFPTQLRSLRNNQRLAPLDKLSRLNPALDENVLLRVGGRISNAPVLHDQKHPIILPVGRIADLIISDTHKKTLHGGLQLTLSTLRQQYWILNARRLVKGHIHKCAKCIRYGGRPINQIMAPLPAARVTPADVFAHTGVDYAGPVNVRTSEGRGHKSHRGYIALFVCLVTRAIHLELVSDYSSQKFLAAFERFTARHGLPSDVYSDNGTTFQGAERELREAVKQIQQDKDLRKTIETEGVTWHFIPPSAPHFGGLWEAGVKSMKTHLKRIMDNFTPTFEEWSTLLCKIERNLNSRPIGPLRDDPDDIEALTPGHFIARRPLNAPPTPSVLDINTNRLSRWQFIQQVNESFWKRWRNEYLHTLQTRGKWTRERDNVKINEIVLIQDLATPPSRWPLARVVDVHQGDDGKVRAVTLKTSTSTLTRPVVKLIPLNVSDATAGGAMAGGVPPQP